MLNKTTLKNIVRTRLAEAKILCENNKCDGAVYLCGYAIEIALKKKICDTLNWKGFPETDNEFQGVTNFKTHNLSILLKLSGEEETIKRTSILFAKWLVIQEWNPEIRYKSIGNIPKKDAKQTIEAVKSLLEFLNC